MSRTFLYRILALVAISAAMLPAQTSRHPLRLDDLARLREVRDPQCSPDGKWVAYVVSTVDAKEDKSSSHIWMIGFDGKGERQITSSQDSESSPRWSPDGKYLSFTSSRPGKASGNQVWQLDRNGGEAFQLTDVKGRLQGYEWAPDSQRLALVVGDPDPEADSSTPASAGGTGARGGATKAPKPIVIDRYKYKQDGQGYLSSGRHTYIYLYDVAARKTARLTDGTWDEASPKDRKNWLPNGLSLLRARTSAGRSLRC